jgi:hypothetical protein
LVPQPWFFPTTWIYSFRVVPELMDFNSLNWNSIRRLPTPFSKRSSQDKKVPGRFIQTLPAAPVNFEISGSSSFVEWIKKC